MKSLTWIFLLIPLYAFTIPEGIAQKPVVKKLTLDATRQYQRIDGFGVNITPAQWRNGNLKPAIDLLIDDLGSTLIRFDCYGKADWLDPSRRGPDGRFPETYLQEIYTRQDFKDAWETFRYLNTKGVEPFLNVSGRIPAALAQSDGQTLCDFEGYAEMVVSLAKWARDKEQLRFKLFSPFNETDLGFPEGPRIPKDAAVPSVRAIIRELDEGGLSDIKLIVMDDSHPTSQYVEALIKDTGMTDRVAGFATHSYGNGGDEDGLAWFLAKSPYAEAINKIENSPYKGIPLWLTEYGDLDQTGEVEFGVAWRSTRRLLKLLNDGLSAGLAWDAFDNFHEHDAAWATYGLLQTDREAWKYTPKRRYYSAKQIYRYVRPGFIRVDMQGPAADPGDVFATWHAPLKHLLVSAFASPDGKDFTVVGMSTVEGEAELNIQLLGLSNEGKSKPVSYYRTSRNEDCRKISEIQPSDGSIKAVVPENAILTLTTVR